MRASFQGERRKSSRPDLWGGRRVTGAFTRNPDCVAGDAIAKFADLLATYFEMGGFQVQPNVVSTETLKDAQKLPENRRDLMVRVSGFCALFTNLHESIQNDIIARSELRA